MCYSKTISSIGSALTNEPTVRRGVGYRLVRERAGRGCYHCVGASGLYGRRVIRLIFPSLPAALQHEVPPRQRYLQMIQQKWRPAKAAVDETHALQPLYVGGFIRGQGGSVWEALLEELR